MLPLGAAEAQGPSPFDNPGLYFGAFGGFFSGKVTIAEEKELIRGPIDGFIGGGLVGYTFQRPADRPVSLSIEADIGFGHLNGIGDETADAVQQVYTYDLQWLGHFGLLAGVPMGNVMPFVRVGGAVAELGIEPLYPTGTVAGVSLGGGINAAFGPNFTGRAEVLYDIFCDKTIAYDSEEGTVGLSGFTFRLAAIFKLPPH